MAAAACGRGAQAESSGGFYSIDSEVQTSQKERKTLFIHSTVWEDTEYMKQTSPGIKVDRLCKTLVPAPGGWAEYV